MVIAKGDIKGSSGKVTLGEPADYPNWRSAREVNNQDKAERPTEDGEQLGQVDMKQYRYELDEDKKVEKIGGHWQ